MDLSVAGQYFDTVNVEGWDGSAWVANVAFGNLAVYDRFISDRSFGQRKRIFTTGVGHEIPTQYGVIRLPDGTVYLLEHANRDIKHDRVYSTVYHMRESAGLVQVIRQVVTPTASGMGGTSADSVIATVYCDIDRYSALSSSQFDTVRYPLVEFWLPSSTPVTTGDELELDGERYNVREISLALDLTYIRALKRGDD